MLATHALSVINIVMAMGLFRISRKAFDPRIQGHRPVKYAAMATYISLILGSMNVLYLFKFTPSTTDWSFLLGRVFADTLVLYFITLTIKKLYLAKKKEEPDPEQNCEGQLKNET